MKKIIVTLGMLCVLVIFFVGCVETEEKDFVGYKAPNWTSDGKIVFVKDSNHVIRKKSLFSDDGNAKGSSEVYVLCEINSDGSGYEEIGVLLEAHDYAYSLGLTNTSSVNDWVVLGMEASDQTEEHIYIIRRDGTGLQEVGEGRYPDFSTDASQIVYEKPNQGIWIMNRYGGNDHAVWADSMNKMPSWSSDGDRIAFVRHEGWQDEDLWVMDINGENRTKLRDNIRVYQPDWGPPDSNAIVCSFSGGTRVVYLDSLIPARDIDGVGTTKWSPDGAYFTGTDEEGIFVMEVDGSNKIHIQP